jgi:hypothetical protein
MYISPELSRERLLKGNCYKCDNPLVSHKRCTNHRCKSLICGEIELNLCESCIDILIDKETPSFTKTALQKILNKSLDNKID